jgi:hypothetical protein
MIDQAPTPPADPPSVRLARSRAELQELFKPEESEAPGGDARAGRQQGAFPRSMTMKLLTRGSGAGGLAVMALALFATSPAKAMRLLRLLPMSAITKIVVARFIQSRGEGK